MLPYDVALFDADDTLFDFPGAARYALRVTLELHGFPYSEEIRQTYMRINEGVWARLERGELTREQLATERFRLFFGELGWTADIPAFHLDYLAALGEGSELLPGAGELCREAASLCRMAVVTNGFARVQAARMEKSGLSRWFEKVYVSEEVGWEKPRREFFDAVLADLGVSDRGRVILLGDSLTSDMAGGIGAGVKTCWYNPGHREPGAVQPDFTIFGLGEFLPILRGETNN